MSKQLLYHTEEMSEVLQKEYTEAFGSAPYFTDDEGNKILNSFYIRWLEIRVYELSGRPQPLPPLEYCGECKQMVQMIDPVSPWPLCPNCSE